MPPLHPQGSAARGCRRTTCGGLRARRPNGYGHEEIPKACVKAGPQGAARLAGIAVDCWAIPWSGQGVPLRTFGTAGRHWGPARSDRNAKVLLPDGRANAAPRGQRLWTLAWHVPHSTSIAAVPIRADSRARFSSAAARPIWWCSHKCRAVMSETPYSGALSCGPTAAQTNCSGKSTSKRTSSGERIQKIVLASRTQSARAQACRRAGRAGHTARPSGRYEHNKLVILRCASCRHALSKLSHVARLLALQRRR